VTAPGVPADKVAILRKAFDDTMQDPEFIADARKRNLDLSPKKGEELDAFFRQFGTPTPEITKEAARLMGLSP
jgi:tripartite-type tricarboxylate transporter receptor subunit TctC